MACQAVLLSGCTSVLWEKERFARCHWPANPPGLRLFYSESARDVLAEYDEASEGTPAIQRRAYWLEPNALAVAAGQQPRFVSVTNAQDLVAVPVTDNLASPPPSAYHGLIRGRFDQWPVLFLMPGGKGARGSRAAGVLRRLRSAGEAGVADAVRGRHRRDHCRRIPGACRRSSVCDCRWSRRNRHVPGTGV